MKSTLLGTYRLRIPHQFSSAVILTDIFGYESRGLEEEFSKSINKMQDLYTQGSGKVDLMVGAYWSVTDALYKRRWITTTSSE